MVSARVWKERAYLWLEKLLLQVPEEVVQWYLMATCISGWCHLKKIMLEAKTFSAFLRGSGKSRKIKEKVFFSSFSWSLERDILSSHWWSLPDFTLVRVFMRKGSYTLLFTHSVAWSSESLLIKGLVNQKVHNPKEYMHPSVHASTVYNNSQDMGATLMSIDRGMNKEDVVRIYNGPLLSHDKEWNNTICSNTDWSRDCHTEWSKSDRGGEILYDIPYMWNPKRNDTNEITYKQKETHRFREWIYGCWAWDS